MTSSSSFPLPATTRAGRTGFAPDESASLPLDDPESTPSFDELCPDEAASLESNDAGPSNLSEPENSEQVDETADEDEDSDETERARRAANAAAVIVIPTILATPRETRTAPIAAATSSGTTTAENAQPSSHRPATGMATQDTSTTPLAAANAKQAGETRAPAEASTPANSSAKALERPTATRPGAADPAVAAAQGLAGQSKGATVAPKDQAQTASEAGEAVALARSQAGKTPGEKSAAQRVDNLVVENGPGENKILSSDSEGLARRQAEAGTRTALSGGNMYSSTSTANRFTAQTGTASAIADRQMATNEMLSVDWKGWTNGGGERTSTAAQFSQLGDKINHIALSAAGPVSAATRGAGSTQQAPAPAPVQVPIETAEALAPIHSAIERLVLHGRDQLALTVRFEQGGSLSLKLAMQEGQISTQIQTDVPGLEAALKSAWNELAQDWNGRGWKLANPEFTGGAASYSQREDSSAGGQAGRNGGRESDEAPIFGARSFGATRRGDATQSPVATAPQTASASRRGIQTWA